MKGHKNGGFAPFLPGGNRQALAARALNDQGVFVALCTFNPFFQKFQGGVSVLHERGELFERERLRRTRKMACPYGDRPSTV